MAEKKLKTRIVHKHEIEANWKQSALIPLQGEIIVYDKDNNYNYERIKIGDGEHNVNELPFVGVGETTLEGGEIFNDYENNVAGSKCFQIIELIDQKTIKLDSIAGLQNGQTISIVLNANYDFYTTIADVKPNNMIILTQELPTEWGATMSSDNEKNKLWVPENPSLGTHYLGKYAHTEGTNNIVSNTAGHSEGGDNITGGKFGHTEGRRNKAGYAAHAQNQDNQALGNFSSAGGQGNIATEIAQDVIGRYNKVNKNAIAIVGNGTSDTDRNNAFEVLKDGSATIDVQGYSANSVIRKDYVDSYFTTMCSANIETNKENVLYGTMGDSLITDLSCESSSGKLIISDTYNLICIDISKFTSNFQDNNSNSYPAISGGGLTLYYKDNKLYLNGTYTAASYKAFSNIGTINFIGGMKYTAQVYDKTVKGIGITISGNNITSGALNVTMSQTNTSGVVSASCDISVNTVGTLTLNVSRDIKFVNQEVKFMLSVGQNRDFVPFNKNQIIDLSKPYDNIITAYQNTTYIYSSAPCYFNYIMYTYDIIKRDYATKKYVDDKISAGGNTDIDLSEYATKEYVDQEIATFDFIKIVDELPETGLENRFYLIPRPTNVIEGYGHASDISPESEYFQPLKLNYLSQCSITTTDGVYPYGSIFIILNETNICRIPNDREENSKQLHFIPHYNCVVNDTTLTVTGNVTSVDTNEELYTVNETFEVPKGALITGVGTWFESGNNYVVSWGNTNLNDIFDEYIWSNEDWEYLGMKSIETDLSAYATKAHLSTTEQELIKHTDENINNLQSVIEIHYATKQYVDEEIAKFDFIKVVSKLPEEGLPNNIYLIPKSGEVKLTYEGYGYTSTEDVSSENDTPFMFDGVSQCLITTSDCLTYDDVVIILTSDGGRHWMAGSDITAWKPLFECSIEGTILSVTQKFVHWDGEHIDWGIDTFEVAEGTLITGVATFTYGNGSANANNYIVTYRGVDQNNMFDEYIWTEENKWEFIGIKQAEIDLENYATKEYVDEEIATFDFIKVVNELPEEGLLNRIYFVPKKSDDLEQENDLFDEYIWMNIGTETSPVYDWEWITTKQLEIDLTNYVQKEEGKGLSTNDFTNAYKTKLDSIVTNDTPKTIDGEESGAVVSVQDVSPVEHDVAVSVSSKNILDANTIFGQQKITELVIDDNSFTARGEVGSGNYAWDAGQIMFPYTNGTNLKSKGFELKAGTTYTVSFNASIQEVGVYGNTIQVLIYRLNDDTDGVAVEYQLYGLTITLEQNNRYSFSFTPSEDTKYGLCFRINNNLMTISNIQIEQAAEDTPFTPYITDTSTVGVKRYGKNLFSPYLILPKNENGKYIKTQFGVTVEYLPDEDCFLFNGTMNKTTAQNVAQVNYNMLGNVGAKYTVSTRYISGELIKGTSNNPLVYLNEGYDTTNSTTTNWINMALDNQDRLSSPTYQNHKVLSRNYIRNVRFYMYPNDTFNNYKVRIQLEESAVATDYEPFKQPVDVVNGTVKSTSPNMTLISDNANAIITVKYNKNINKAINIIPSNNEDRQIATIGDIKKYIDTSILGGAW